VTIRVGVADDQALVRDGFRYQLGRAPDVELVGEAADGAAAVALARSALPDVMVMDLRMPVLDGVEATRRITSDAATAGVRVLVVTTFSADDLVYAALRAGASGFVLKDVTPEQLLDAVRVVASGEALLSPTVTTRLVADLVARPAAGQVDERRLAALTDREREVLRLVARGLSNADVARQLVVSPATAKTHVSRLLGKLDLHDRAQLVVAAYESGLVVPGQAG
jgi:DNA-binding NarL/FixJ family response regulator